MKKKAHPWRYFKRKSYFCTAKQSSNGRVAQLNRVSDYGSEGCRFESCRDHKKKSLTLTMRIRLPLFCIIRLHTVFISMQHSFSCDACLHDGASAYLLSVCLYDDEAAGRQRGNEAGGRRQEAGGRKRYPYVFSKHTGILTFIPLL